MDTKKVRVAAVGDIHVREGGMSYKDMFARLSEEADVLLLCGDLTQHGQPVEAELLAKDLAACKIPVLCVLGNHDCDKNKQEEIKQILIQSRVIVLNGTSHEVKGVGFAGTKGFNGGFDKFMLASFGEKETKDFVNIAINETIKLEKAIAELTTPHKIVVLHYSPIRATVEGEPPEIHTFLGCSRLLEPIERYEVDYVFHGHAHHGTHEGKTLKGIPVYNVSYPLMTSITPENPYKIVELEVEASVERK